MLPLLDVRRLTIEFPTQGSASAQSQLARIFLNRAIGAAYTPVSLGPDGRIYALNDGVLFVLGK